MRAGGGERGEQCPLVVHEVYALPNFSALMGASQKPLQDMSGYVAGPGEGEGWCLPCPPTTPKS